jgi:hypothetical protein
MGRDRTPLPTDWFSRKRRTAMVFAVGIVVVGLAWSLVSAERGRQAVARVNTAAEASRGRWLYDWDTCMEAQLERAVPKGSRVYVGAAPDPYFQYGVMASASGRYTVVPRRDEADYALGIAPVGANDAAACPHRSGRGPWPLGVYVRLTVQRT